MDSKDVVMQRLGDQQYRAKHDHELRAEYNTKGQRWVVWWERPSGTVHIGTEWNRDGVRVAWLRVGICSLCGVKKLLEHANASDCAQCGVHRGQYKEGARAARHMDAAWEAARQIRAAQTEREAVDSLLSFTRRKQERI
jgi:hypothetical protein